MKPLVSFALLVLLLAGGVTPSAFPRAHAAAQPLSSETSAPDCNGNGVEDAVDIASGYSVDQDGNGIPDECDNSRR